MENRERIKTIRTLEDKKQEERFLRRLWKECFGDPPAYEDFYFKNVYQNNIVYVIEDKGMLHLNPYPCIVHDKEMILHYIVGVATTMSERRKGIMGKLLVRALNDMYKEKEAFTYLMPANVQYYQSFDFVSICDKKETVLPERKEGNIRMPATGNQIICKEFCQAETDVGFVRYRELLNLYGQEEQNKMFQCVNRMLSDQYDVFAKHNKVYFDLLLKEKQCQGGDVVFCFDSGLENIKGFFAYGKEKGNLFVEQYLLEKNQIESCLMRYHKGTKTTIQHFPFMVRVVHVKTFLTVFAGQFHKFADEGKRLLITDPILKNNDGIYTFYESELQIFVEKQSLEEDVGKSMWDVHMTTEELARFVFCGQNAKYNKVYFAEVV